MNKFLLLLSFITPVYSVDAQDFISFENKYTFIQYDINKIDLPGDSLDFMMFMKKFDRLSGIGEGNINIVHFGGSHIQADMWTREIRQNFDRFLNQNNSSRGSIFPYKAVRTNGSNQYNVEYNKVWSGLRNVMLNGSGGRMGLMGWKATATDSGQYIQVTLNNDDYTKFYFDELRVFYDTGIQYFSFSIEVDSIAYMANFDTTCNCAKFEFEHPINKFLLTVHKLDSQQNEFNLYGIQTHLHGPGLTYHSVGVNGASIPSYLNCPDLEQQLALLNPDLIIFSIGINDAFGKNFSRESFENNYSELMRRIRKTCPNTAFLFTTNTDSYRRIRRRVYKNYNGNEVKAAMYHLARQNGAAVWDLYSVMGGLGSIASWKKNGLAQRDLIHLTNAGYTYLGDLFFDAFLKKYESFILTPFANFSYE